MSARLAQLVPALIGVLIAAAASTALWAWLGRPIALPDAPGGKFECLSYSPYKGSQTPFDKTFVAPRAQIEEDLGRLAPATRCVRTYSSAQGLDAVAELAPDHDLDVLLGIWIAAGPKDNAKEIEAGLRAAQAHPERVRAIVVGNETLLRRELTAAQLIDEIDKVRARTKLPLTYADVWEFWLKNPEVADHVDFITVHILPYWEDYPVSIDASLAHVQEVLDKVKAAFPGKPILIGETGWPSEGRSRETAVPGRVNQARFVREFIQLAQRNGVRYNLIEALDQPWKRRLEGTVGGYWGLLDEARQVKWPLVGPVSEYPDWKRHAALAGLLALATVAWGLGRGAVLRLPQWLALALIGAVQGSALVLQWRLVETASKHALEWGFYLALTLASAVAWLSLAARVATPSSGWATARPASLEAVRRWLKRPRAALIDPALVLGIAQAVLGVATAVIAVTLVFDPRYRDFPIAIVLPAAVALLARSSFAQRAALLTRSSFTEPAALLTRSSFAQPAVPDHDAMERALAWIMLACVPLGIAIEQWVNVEAIVWAVTLALLAWPLLRRPG